MAGSVSVQYLSFVFIRSFTILSLYSPIHRRSLVFGIKHHWAHHHGGNRTWQWFDLYLYMCICVFFHSHDPESIHDRNYCFYITLIQYDAVFAMCGIISSHWTLVCSFSISVLSLTIYLLLSYMMVNINFFIHTQIFWLFGMQKNFVFVWIRVRYGHTDLHKSI